MSDKPMEKEPAINSSMILVVDDLPGKLKTADHPPQEGRLENEDEFYQPFVPQISEWIRLFDMQSIQNFLEEKQE